MALFNKKDKQKKEKEKPQKKPLEIWYTEDGTKIGDDGAQHPKSAHSRSIFAQLRNYGLCLSG